MNKKVLFTAKVDSHIRHFHLPYLRLFHEYGYEVHVASEGEDCFDNCDEKYNVVFGKNPFSKSVIRNYKFLKKLMMDNQYEIIHTHTAIASVLTRFAAYRTNKILKQKSKIIYTAHGFQFLKGGPLRDWLLYFPVEFLMSKITDVLILINQEDYDLANKFKMGRERRKVNGVGINLEKFSSSYKTRSDDFVITYIAELNKNKNQKLLIDSVELVFKEIPNLKVQLIGSGESKDFLKEYIEKKKLTKYVHLLGYRKDVPNILKGTDLIVATSLREGLPVNVIESMAAEKPIIVTDCRGQRDLINNNITGKIVPYDKRVVAEAILALYHDEELAKLLAKNAKFDSEKYTVQEALECMRDIYNLKGA